MKNNKLLSFVIAIAFTFVSMLACFPGVIASASTIELTEADYENAAAVLKMINPDMPLSDGEVTTREEFVAAVTMILNMPSGTSVSTGFRDVSEDSPYAANISYAKGLGLISNVDLFYPDSPVTYAQAVKILMVAAGYGQKAEYMGGFPTGYLKMANDAGVGSGFAVSTDATLSHMDAIALIYEAATTDMMEPTTFGDSYEYTVTKGKNILSTYHKIFMAEGIVEANENTGLLSISGAVGDDTIKIDGKNFVGKDCVNLIGKKARVLYKNETKNEIIYAYAVGNEITEYNQEDTLSISGSALTVSPIDKDKDETYRLESGYSVIYNGKYHSASDYNSVINPTAGTVTLIDNDDNSSIDVIIVKEIQYGVVSSVNEFDEKIYDSYKKNGLIDLSDAKYVISEKDGTPLKLDELESGDVLGIVKSNDGKFYDIIRYSERIGGTYEAKNSNDEIVVKGTAYKLSDYYTDNVKALETIKMGSDVILHLGEGNQVIYVEEFTTALEYGMFIDAAQLSGLNGSYMVKIYSQDGAMLEVSLAKKVRVNGASQKDTDAYTMISAIGTRDLWDRVIKFSLNANGELAAIYDTVDNTIGPDVYTKENIAESNPVLYSDNYDVNADQELFYKGGVFYPYFAAASSCIIMKVPADDAYKGEDKYYKMSSVTELNQEDRENMVAFGYDVDKSGAAFVLVPQEVGSAATSVTGEPTSAIVESVALGLNADGEEAAVAKIYRSGEWKEYYSNDDTKAAVLALKPGDIVGFVADSFGEITAIETHFSFADNKSFKFPRATYNGDGTIDREGDVGPLAEVAYGGKVVGYVGGYAYSFSGGKAALIRGDRKQNEENKDINHIANVASDPNLSFASADVYPVSLSVSKTIFVKFINDRSTGKTTSAQVFKEADMSSLETYFNAGTDADYVVSRERYHSVSLNIVYVNEYVN